MTDIGGESATAWERPHDDERDTRPSSSRKSARARPWSASWAWATWAFPHAALQRGGLPRARASTSTAPRSMRSTRARATSSTSGPSTSRAREAPASRRPRISRARGEADALILCVPTPLNKYREPDLSFIIDTTESLGAAPARGQLVSLESTTYRAPPTRRCCRASSCAARGGQGRVPRVLAGT
jgi:hypothetical protein